MDKLKKKPTLFDLCETFDIELEDIEPECSEWEEPEKYVEETERELDFDDDQYWPEEYSDIEE